VGAAGGEEARTAFVIIAWVMTVFFKTEFESGGGFLGKCGEHEHIA
jgi:hypothetical protein